MSITTAHLRPVVYKLEHTFNEHTYYVQELNLRGVCRWYVVLTINDPRSILDAFKDGSATADDAMRAWMGYVVSKTPTNSDAPKCALDLVREVKRAKLDEEAEAERLKARDVCKVAAVMQPLVELVNELADQPAAPCRHGSALRCHVDYSNSYHRGVGASKTIELSCGAKINARCCDGVVTWHYQQTYGASYVEVTFERAKELLISRLAEKMP